MGISMPWVTIFTSSVIAALLTQGLAILRDYLNVRRDAKHSALYLALAIENYANDCIDIYSNITNYISSKKTMGRYHSNLNPLPDFPDTIDFKSLGIKTVNEVLSFRVLVDSTRSMLAHTEADTMQDAYTEVAEYALRTAKKGVMLATQIRQNQKLPIWEPIGEWNFFDYIEESFALWEAKKSGQAKD